MDPRLGMKAADFYLFKKPSRDRVNQHKLD